VGVTLNLKEKTMFKRTYTPMQAHILDKAHYVDFIAVHDMYSPFHDSSARLGGAKHYHSVDDFLQALEDYEAQGFEVLLEEIDYYDHY
jgi:hypothetical protein|tara:strand:+ start:709 stop:972 length:264 start_codon:yes stop_codon:yes gene_type:complete